jgi:uncharacterized membrane protein YhaH (DUF805 family)
MEWYFEVLWKYTNFNGRAGRKEFWIFTLFYVIFGLGAIILDRFIMDVTGMKYMSLTILYQLVLLTPGLSVTVRRLHDVSKRGWMILIVFIPAIGIVWLLVLLITKSAAGDNNYGPYPTE